MARKRNSLGEDQTRTPIGLIDNDDASIIASAAALGGGNDPLDQLAVSLGDALSEANGHATSTAPPFGSGDAAFAHVSSGAPTVSTDHPDYAPGSTATITASNFSSGSTVEFQVTTIPNGGPAPGSQPWFVTDGVRYTLPGPDGILGTADDIVAGDLDGVVNRSITTTWYVDPYYASKTMELTATGVSLGAGGSVTPTGQVASTVFSDATLVDLTGILGPDRQRRGFHRPNGRPRRCQRRGHGPHQSVRPTPGRRQRRAY